MIHAGVALSLVGALLLPPTQTLQQGFLITKPCGSVPCVTTGDVGVPRGFVVPNPGPGPTRRPPRGTGPSGPSGPPPTECEPRDPRPAKADVKAMPIPEGRLTHEGGDAPVVVGMPTEWRWEGPQTVSWTQPGRAGVREDCSLVPAERTRFTASLRTLLFDFEQGKKKRYLTDTGRVTHRYTTIPADEGEEQFTLCVYAGYEVPGEGFNVLMLVEEFDHDVVEIHSTLIE